MAVMAYKAALGLSEIVMGVLLEVPSFDPQATFARLSAEELREDPGDRFVALIRPPPPRPAAPPRPSRDGARRARARQAGRAWA
jgi:hypothetical protein